MRPMFSRRLIVVPLLVCACYSWTPVPVAPKVSAELPAHSRVVRKGGKQVALYKAHVTADSIIGSQWDSARYAVSRDSVARVEDRHFAPLRTIGLFFFMGLGAAAALVVSLGSGGT